MFAALHCRHRIAPMNAPPAASNPPPLSSINERDIDLMILIALHGSAAFRAALVKKLSGMAIAEFIGAWLEVHTEEGETDLLLEVRTEGGERLAIVIQVKIDPSFRWRQSERCRSRGKMGRAQGHWDRFLTCHCAPKRYASLCVRVGDWDHVLFLEDVAEVRIPRQSGRGFRIEVGHLSRSRPHRLLPAVQQLRHSCFVDDRRGDWDAGEAGTEHATIATSIATSP